MSPGCRSAVSRMAAVGGIYCEVGGEPRRGAGKKTHFESFMHGAGLSFIQVGGVLVLVCGGGGRGV